MKYFKLRIFVLALLLSNIAGQVTAKPPSVENMLFNSAQGREFWIAIPPNEIQSYNTNVLDIYVTSSKNTNVTISNPYTGMYLTKPVYAMQITTFSSKKGELGWDLEVRESEQITTKGLKLEADQPISVYVLNAKPMTSDGYLALPTSALGTEYIHCAYYDFKEIREWASGFIVIASENNTRIQIELKGRGFIGRTWAGRKIGDKIDITLNKGQTYLVSGNGKTRGEFDMTGTRIIANKPIGLVSHHMRTIIPSFDIYNGRDHLCEMLPPVTAWGKKYVTVEYKRDSDKGDFFRVVASQPNTYVKTTYYDRSDGKILGHWDFPLKNAGDFNEYLEVFTRTPNPNKSLRGTTIIEADKPILVMQYAYSAEWDGNPIFDPFMIIVVPVEQYIPSTVFQTPENKSFNTNWFNIIAAHDTNDVELKDLKSIKLDDTPIWVLEGKFLFQRIPTTNLYWAKLPVKPGAHRIKGDTKFGGYIYGFSQYDSYGWPAAMALNKLDETDTLPPVLTRTGNCGNYSAVATEKRNGAEKDNPRQIDQGVNTIELLEDSYNYNLTITAPDPFKPYPPVYQAEFRLDVIDKYKDAFALYSVMDRSGNYSIDSVRYSADSLSLSPAIVDYGSVRLKSSKTLSVFLKNENNSTVIIRSVKLLVGDAFKIDSGDVPPEITLQPGQIHEMKISYTPKNESFDPSVFDTDSLEVLTSCDLRFVWPLKGRGVIPRILVEDWDAGPVVLTKNVCKKQQTGTGLSIRNIGTDTLVITNIRGVVAPFSLSTPFTPQIPIIIPPRGEVWLETPCFTPVESKFYTIDVTFESNADGIDSISTWTGNGIQPGPAITPYDWKRRRVNTLNSGEVYISNSGTSPVKITGIKLSNPAGAFSIKSAIPDPSVVPVNLYPDTSTATGVIKKITVYLEFHPDREGDFHDTILPVFDQGEPITPGSVFNFLDGFGFLPYVELTGWEYLPSVLVNTVHPVTGFVTIRSTSKTADLYVEEIRWKNPSQTDFSWLATPQSKFIIPMGDSIRIPVRFIPSRVGAITELVEVVSDAHQAPDSIVVNDTIVSGSAFDKGIVVDSVDFEVIMHCDESEKEFHVRNIGTTNPATVQRLEVITGTTDIFEILTQPPVIIDAGKTAGFRVKYKPYNSSSMSDFMLIKVYTDVDTQFVRIRGTSDTLSVSFGLRSYAADAKLNPGTKVNLDVSISNNTNATNYGKPFWQSAAITDIYLEIEYNPEWMVYTGNIEKGSMLDNSWRISATETKGTPAKLAIHASGAMPVISSGIIFMPEFRLLLSDVTSFEPQINNTTLSFGNRNICVGRQGYPGRIELNTCVKNIRGITSSAKSYFLDDIEPNPVSGKNVNIKFGTGLESQSRLELVNSSGEIIRILMDERKAAGSYELLFDAGDLSAGTYFIRMNAGPFSDMKQMVIVK